MLMPKKPIIPAINAIQIESNKKKYLNIYFLDSTNLQLLIIDEIALML